MKMKIYIHSLLTSPEAVPQLSAYNCDMSQYECGAVIEVREIDVELPSQDTLVAKQVGLFQAQMEKIYTEAEIRARGVKEQLERFLAITNSPSQETSS
jgi:hypothetical protein